MITKQIIKKVQLKSALVLDILTPLMLDWLGPDCITRGVLSEEMVVYSLL